MGFEVTRPFSLGDAFGWSTWSSVPLLFVTTALLGGPLFEEIGWRGFLQDELQRRRTVLVSTAVVAMVWAVWHLPLLVSEPTGQRPPLPFLLWVLAQAVVLAWVYNTSSGSVLLAILFHAAANVSGRLLLEPFVGQDGFVGAVVADGRRVRPGRAGPHRANPRPARTATDDDRPRPDGGSDEPVMTSFIGRHPVATFLRAAYAVSGISWVAPCAGEWASAGTCSPDRET